MAIIDKHARFTILLDAISKTKGKWFKIADLRLSYGGTWALHKLKHVPEIEVRMIPRGEGDSRTVGEFLVTCGDFKVISDRFKETGKIRPPFDFDEASKDKPRKQVINKYKRTKEDKLLNLVLGYTK